VYAPVIREPGPLVDRRRGGSKGQVRDLDDTVDGIDQQV
jgi:hypothetical protein